MGGAMCCGDEREKKVGSSAQTQKRKQVEMLLEHSSNGASNSDPSALSDPLVPKSLQFSQSAEDGATEGQTSFSSKNIKSEIHELKVRRQTMMQIREVKKQARSKQALSLEECKEIHAQIHVLREERHEASSSFKAQKISEEIGVLTAQLKNIDLDSEELAPHAEELQRMIKELDVEEIEEEMDAEVDELDRALENLEAAAHSDEIDETIESAKLLMQLAEAKHMYSDTNGALADYLEARRIYEVIGSLHTLEGSVVLSKIAHVKKEQEEWGEALGTYIEARGILEEINSLKTAEGTNLLTEIGHVKRMQEDFDGAIAVYTEVQSILSELGTFKTVEGCTLLVNIGHAKRQKNDKEGALESYGQAKALLEETGNSGSKIAKECERHMKRLAK